MKPATSGPKHDVVESDVQQDPPKKAGAPPQPSLPTSLDSLDGEGRIIRKLGKARYPELSYVAAVEADIVKLEKVDGHLKAFPLWSKTICMKEGETIHGNLRIPVKGKIKSPAEILGPDDQLHESQTWAGVVYAKGVLNEEKAENGELVGRGSVQGRARILVTDLDEPGVDSDEERQTLTQINQKFPDTRFPKQSRRYLGKLMNYAIRIQVREAGIVNGKIVQPIPGCEAHPGGASPSANPDAKQGAKGN